MAKRKRMKRIGILTGGGDCPGLNAVIRAVAKTAMHERDIEVVGFLDGYDGLVRCRYIDLDWQSVSNILTQGGTILGTSNIANPFRWPVGVGKKMVYRDCSDRAVKTLKSLGLDALVTIGGDGTMAIAGRLAKKGVPIIGVPKTIDNDVWGTELTFGFHTAVQTATEAIDRLHSTASAHHRVMIAEVMGRYAGWIALDAGVASGSDVILIPEMPYRLDSVCETCLRRSRKGKRFTIICVAEGARPKGGQMVVKRRVKASPDPIRLGGIGKVLAIDVEAETAIESRVTVLGYLQRGGTPSAFDRVFATQLGHHAARLLVARRFGRMVAYKAGRITDVSLATVAGKTRKVPVRHPLIAAARTVGTSFGD